MATYEYDEAGVMAAYFLITFLALVLVPLTISVFTTRSAQIKDSCGCSPCIAQRKKLSEEHRGSIFVPNFRSKTFFLLGGWSFFAFVCYRASLLKVETKIYNPFEILGIDTNTPDKDIKSHFKKLSRMYHPDKVKVTVNLTIEAIQERFVDLTKAYKSLTDERIKENWVKYNHPDGPQPTTMGIALPKWIIEGKNNIWVLGVYGLVFGGALPALVGRWWFGSRQKTKDGINAQSAAAFFKSIKEESSMEEIVGTLGKAYKWELPGNAKMSDEVDQLEKTIEGRLGSKWTEVRKLAEDYDGQLHKLRREALILLYSHLLRLDIQDAALQKRQKKVILQTPLLLNALLNVSIARNWLSPSLFVMRLQAYLAQALPPTAPDNQCFTQLPGIGYDEIHKIAPKAKDMSEFLRSLEEKKDPRVSDVKKAMERWGHVEIVDAAFKVIGESIVTPSSIVFLLVKLRISPPGVIVAKKAVSPEQIKRLMQANDKIDEEFLTSRQDAEDLDASSTNGSAHAPFWPGNRKPSWWIVLADDKSNRVVVPPLKISDIPYSRPDSDRNYRAFKIQFQCPPNTGLFTWKIYVVSDTFVGEEATIDLAMKVEEPPIVNDQGSDDDISEPDEDSLAGQMAAMRGGPVKKIRSRKEESDDESSTDDDDKENGDSDSDSD